MAGYHSDDLNPMLFVWFTDAASTITTSDIVLKSPILRACTAVAFFSSSLLLAHDKLYIAAGDFP